MARFKGVSEDAALVEDHAQRPAVGFVAIGKIRTQLGTEIVRRAHNRLRKCSARVLNSE